MRRRYLVIWYDGNDNRASLIDDSETDPKFPYGVSETDVDETCESITAIILVADAPIRPFVVMDDECVMGGEGADTDELVGAESE